jgi:hypothetical protein
MTSKRGLLAVLLLCSLTLAENTQQPPTMDLSDMSDADKALANVDPSQKQRDKKIWNNVLKSYLGFRQLAKSGLETMESARDMAFTANKYFQVVMKIGKVGMTVVQNASHIKEFFIWDENDDWRDRFWNVLESVEYLEEDIFQNTDWIIYESPKRLQEKRTELRMKRAAFVNKKNASKEAFKEAFIGPVKRSLIYESVMRRRMGLKSDAEKAMYEETDGNGPQQRQMLSNVVANRVTASKAIKEAEIDNNTMLTDQLIAQQDPTGEASETQIAEANNILQRNIMVQKFQQHSHMKDECEVAAHLLLARVYPYEVRAASRKVQRVGAVQISGEQ